MKTIQVFDIEWEHNYDQFRSYESHGEPLWECLKDADAEAKRLPWGLEFKVEDEADLEELHETIAEKCGAVWHWVVDYKVEEE